MCKVMAFGLYLCGRTRHCTHFTRNTLPSQLVLADVKESDYDGLFFPGGHGPMFDLGFDSNSQKLISAFLAAGKPVAALCHGPIVFADVVDSEGKYVVAGKKITGFSNSEEEAVS